MLDYKAWIERAASFINQLPDDAQWHVQAPASEEVVAKLAPTLSRGLPPPLRRFATHGSAGCDFQYWWSIPTTHRRYVQDTFLDRTQAAVRGGGPLCMLGDYAAQQLACQDGVNLMMKHRAGGSLHDRAFWTRGVPFMWLGNGDVLALDPERDPMNPAVAYLEHEATGASRVLCESFDEFLMIWEELCYLDLIYWAYLDCFDENGMLTAKSAKSADAKVLVALLRGG